MILFLDTNRSFKRTLFARFAYSFQTQFLLFQSLLSLPLLCYTTQFKPWTNKSEPSGDRKPCFREDHVSHQLLCPFNPWSRYSLFPLLLFTDNLLINSFLCSTKCGTISHFLANISSKEVFYFLKLLLIASRLNLNKLICIHWLCGHQEWKPWEGSGQTFCSNFNDSSLPFFFTLQIGHHKFQLIWFERATQTGKDTRSWTAIIAFVHLINYKTNPCNVHIFSYTTISVPLSSSSPFNFHFLSSNIEKPVTKRVTFDWMIGTNLQMILLFCTQFSENCSPL